MRLLAIQAIELYLNALLLEHDHTAAQVRGLQHNLEERAKLAAACGLVLRAKTKEHLRAMGRKREYLVMRYGPEMASTASQINRLLATLDEVGAKVSERVRSKARPARLSGADPGKGVAA